MYPPLYLNVGLQPVCIHHYVCMSGCSQCVSTIISACRVAASVYPQLYLHAGCSQCVSTIILHAGCSQCVSTIIFKVCSHCTKMRLACPNSNLLKMFRLNTFGTCAVLSQFNRWFGMGPGKHTCIYDILHKSVQEEKSQLPW